MKELSNNLVVSHWVNQIIDYGQNRNKTLYFEGPTLFSYGPHSLIARIYKECALFNSKNYSITTSNHSSMAVSAYWAYRGNSYFFVPHVFVCEKKLTARKTHYKNIKYLMDRVYEGCRSYRRKNGRVGLAELKRLMDDLLRYIDCFEVFLSKALREEILNLQLRLTPCPVGVLRCWETKEL
jgi:hypothetical protein